MYISHRVDQNLNTKINEFKEFKELNFNFDTIYEFNEKSETEVCYGNSTKNGSNNLIIKIIKSQKN